MQKRNRGGQKGNKNAARPPDRKPRIAFSMSLYGDRLEMIEDEAKEVGTDDLAKLVRQQIYDWLDERVKQWKQRSSEGDIPTAA